MHVMRRNSLLTQSPSSLDKYRIMNVYFTENLIEMQTKLWRNKCATFSLVFVSKFGLTTPGN